MKLVIQIPCFNEAATLPLVLQSLPRMVPGFSTVETLVIDDGSTDDSAEVARAYGATHVLRFPRNRGLAKAFASGMAEAVRLGADCVVNMDADHQYRAADIPKLVEPIVNGQSDLVIGCRQIDEIPHFSPLKKGLQYLGSWVVRKVSGLDVPDAPSGFRALSRAACLRLHVFDNYTYTLEMLVQAGLEGLAVRWVPIRVQPDLRPSRLIRSHTGYVARGAVSILRTWMIYRPLAFFGRASLTLLAMSASLAIAAAVAQSTALGVAGAVLMPLAFLALMAGCLGTMLAANRRVLERLIEDEPVAEAVWAAEEEPQRPKIVWHEDDARAA
jgi:glycosyltransferase involved in cell wall biosynthesis